VLRSLPCDSERPTERIRAAPRFQSTRANATETRNGWLAPCNEWFAGFEFQVGQRKIDVVQQLGEHILPSSANGGSSVCGSAADFRSSAVCEALDSSQLVIDATTTLEVPRELAGRETVSRSASVFVTPSGRDAVLLMEDAGRTTRRAHAPPCPPSPLSTPARLTC